MEDYRLEQTGQEVQDIMNGAAMQTELAAETERATAAEQQLQGNIDAEEFRAKAAELANATAIETINGKIPAEASAQNKLVDNAALQGTYYTKDAVDNLIQGLGQNDVIVGTLPASGVANTIYRVPGDGVYSDYMWYDGAWQLLATYSANIQGCQYIGIATPTTNPGTPSNNVFYFAHEAGTYTNFGSIAVTQGINILKFDGTSWTLEQLAGIDDVPVPESSNLVKGGGILKYSCILEDVEKSSEDQEVIDDYINASNKWASGTSVLLSVNPQEEDFVFIRAHLTGGSNCAFLTSDAHTRGEDVSTFAGGATGRKFISAGTEATLRIPSDAAYFYYYNNSSYRPRKVTVQKLKSVQEYYGETKSLPEDSRNNIMAVYVIGSVTFNDDSGVVDFAAGSILYYKLRESGTAMSSYTFSEDTSFTLTASKKLVVRDGEVVLLNATTAILSTDIVLLAWNSGEFKGGVLFSAYLDKKIEDTDAKIAAVDEKCSVTIDEPLYRYLKIDGSGNVVSADSATNRVLKYDVSDLVGLEIKIHGYRLAGNSYNWWTILDSAGSVVSSSGSSSSSAVRDLTMTVPANSSTLYVFGTATETERLPFIVIPVNKAVNHESGKVSTRRFKMDFSYISPNTGRVGAYDNYTNPANQHTTDYIKVHKTITISGLGGITVPMNVFFYDEDMAFINYTTYQDATNGLDTVNVDVFEQASWFRISFQLSNDSYELSPVYYKDNSIVISSEWDGNDVSKAPYREYTPFLYSVRANVPYKIADNPSVITKTLFGYDQGLIHLPPSYTHNGAPTPVIFFIHGNAERYSTGESTFSGHMKMQQCWSDAGFAQVDLDLIPSCYVPQVGANSGGTHDDYECLSAAWEWLTNHFNVDKRGFYLIGRSRGASCLFQTLSRGGAIQLPIIAAVSMAGATALFDYRISSKSDSTESMWQLWCDARGLPTEGRPSWGNSPEYSVGRSFLKDPDIYNFVVANWETWWRKALIGWGLITYNPEVITPKDFFDNWVYPIAQGVDYTGDSPEAQAMEAFLWNMVDTMEMKSPVPLRFDWCVGDRTTPVNPFDANIVSGTTTLSFKILNKTPQSNTFIRIWDGVDPTNPYGETNPHFAENMIFYDGDLVLPNGVVTHNPSKVTMEWLIWCMGHDPRYQTINYTLPWDS